MTRPDFAPDDAELRAFLAGELDEGAAARLATRLEADVDLAARLDQLASAVDDDGFGGTLAAAFESATDEHGGRPDAAPRIDGYSDLRLLQRGGQGVVYLGRQVSTDRAVALKILDAPHGVTRRQQARFEREIELASALEHPNVVRVFDRGETSDGRAWFVMEFVDGLAFDRHAAEHALTLPARLQLFDRLCAAVAFAHGRGVLHRDLKPENVLVDGAGEPRVLDFGLAKLPGDDEQPDSLVTRAGEFVGTLAFAAPEQLLGDGTQLDIRTDIHALGVLLYRLLAGQHPFATDGALGELVQRITQDDPPPPSRTPGALAGLDADLDALCLTCLAKDPQQRYSSVDALRDDLARWRAGLPLRARSDRRGYVLRRLLRRHRWAVAGLASVLIGLSAATVVSVSALADAQAETRRATNLGDFLVDTLLAAVPGTEPADVTVRELVARAGQDVGTRFVDEPASEATVRNAIGRVLRASGDYDSAREHHSRAWDLGSAHLGRDHEETLAARLNMAHVALSSGDLADAEQLLDEVDAALAHEPDDHALRQPLAQVAGVLRVAQGRAGDAVQVVRAAVRAARHDGQHAGAANLLALLADALREAGALETALEVGHEAEQALVELHGREHPRLDLLRHNQALVLDELGQHAAALATLEPLAARMADQLGADHPGAIMAAINLAGMRAHAGEVEQGLAEFVELVERTQARFGDGHRLTHDALHGLGSLLLAVGASEDAVPLLRAAFEGRAQQLGAAHRGTLRTQIELAMAEGRSGRLEQAEALLSDAATLARDTHGPGSIDTLAAQQVLAVLLLDTERPAAAEALLAEAWAAAREQLPADHEQPPILRQQRALALARLGRDAEALSELEANHADLARSSPAGGVHRQQATALGVQLAERLGDAAALDRWRARQAALGEKTFESE